MIEGAAFPTAYKSEINNTPAPPCNPPTCFVGSYPPVTTAGEMGPWTVNTYFLRPDRRSELPGPIPVREKTLMCRR